MKAIVTEMKYNFEDISRPVAPHTTGATLPATTPADLREPYTPPTLEVYPYVVEHGYALTIQNEVKNYEEFSEITDTRGENYHGEWF